MAMRLHQILTWLGQEPVLTDRPVTGASIDTRTLKPGELFFALQGEKTDGHSFIGQALEKGAAAVLAKSGKAAEAKAVICVTDPLEAMQHIAHQRRLLFSGPVIAVTGSNGKTTTREMIAAVLSRKFRVHKTEGNLNNHIGVPLTLLNCPDDAEVMVVEMGMNHEGEIRLLADIARPGIGLITNIGRGHLGNFKSIDRIGRAKAELLERLKPAGIAFLNGDDLILKAYQHVLPDTRCFGFESGHEITGQKIPGSSDYPAMRVHDIEIRLQVPGEHQLYNALAAVAIGLAMDVSMPEIADALNQFRACSQRMEKMNAGGVQILNDTYNANPDSMVAALETLTGLQAHRHVAILGDMLELGDFSADQHRRLGEMVQQMNIDLFWGVGEAMKEAFSMIHLNGSEKRLYFSSVDEVMPAIQNHIKSGDAVLVKGSRGMHMEQVVDALLRKSGTGKHRGA